MDKNKASEQKRRVKMRFKAFAILLLILGTAVLPFGAEAFIPVRVGGSFDTVRFTVSCDFIEWNPDVVNNYSVIGFATTTEMHYGGSNFYPIPPWAYSGGGASGAGQTCEQTFGGGIASDVVATYMTGQPAGTYYFVIFIEPNPFTDWADADMYFLEFEWDGANVTDYEFIDNSTHFIYLDPNSDNVVASSTPFWLRTALNIMDDDREADMYVRLKISRQTDRATGILQTIDAIMPPTYAFGTGGLWRMVDPAGGDIYVDFPASEMVGTPYEFFSTTTELTQIGRYTLTAELRSDTWYTNAWNWLESRLDVFGIYNLEAGLVLSTSTTFIVDDTTSFDDFIDNTQDAIAGLSNEQNASSTIEMVKGACNPLSGDFDVSMCLAGIFGVNIPENGQAINGIYDNLLSYAPIGYLTRFITIASNPATTSLPVVSYTFASGPLTGENITMDPFSYVSLEEGTPLGDLKSDQPESKNVWQIFEPFYTTAVYLILVIVLLGDILNIAIGTSGSSRRGKGRAEPSYSRN